MKDKILMLVIGVLLGAIITAGCFMLFSKQSYHGGQSNMGERPEMGNFIQDGNGGPKNRKNGNTIQSTQNTVTQNNM